MNIHPQTLAKIIGFKQVGDFTLEIIFEDTKSPRIDFLPFLTGPLFEPLRDKSFFAKVSINPEAHTLVWPNGADFDPGMLHDWDQLQDEFRNQVAG